MRAPEHGPEWGDAQFLVSAVAQEQSLGFLYLPFGQRTAAQDELGSGEVGLGRLGDQRVERLDVVEAGLACFPVVMSPWRLLMATATRWRSNVPRASFSPTPNLPTTWSG
jgi:hypothetical protein